MKYRDIVRYSDIQRIPVESKCVHEGEVLKTQ